MGEQMDVNAFAI